MNRIDTTPVTRDPAGNTLDDGRRQYHYNAMNRLSRLDDRTTGIHAQYHYNPLGQRIRKQLTGAQTQDIRYLYGQEGELLGEYDRNGERIREYIYQRSSTFPELIAQIEADGGITYIHTDHLGSPRLATNQNQTVIWRWDSEAFGGTSPEEDPDGDGRAFVFNLRAPGQYYDSESGLFYNYHRYYDPGLGRYITSDPIGLEGGLNTYTYALNNPIILYDPLGLWVPPSLPQGFVIFSAGLGDALLLGFGDDLRDLFNIDGGIDRCSKEYKGGEIASFAVGGARVAYAGIAKGISLVPRVTGAQAASARNTLKKIFRGGLFPNARRYPYSQLLKKYGSDAAVKAAAGRTNTSLNAIGAGIATGAAVNNSECECQ